jgi:purine-binding chemotaxis protein CheW
MGDNLYAVEMESAREVVVFPALTNLPSAPSHVLGVFNLRGEIVPVFDAPRLLGLDSMSAFTHLTIVDTDAGPAGLAMTSVGESVELGDDAEPSDTPGTSARHRLRNRVVVVIDPGALVAGTDPAG